MEIAGLEELLRRVQSKTSKLFVTLCSFVNKNGRERGTSRYLKPERPLPPAALGENIYVRNADGIGEASVSTNSKLSMIHE